MYRKAQMGIGTLIFLIAVLMVAAIAGAVLIQTGFALRNRAWASSERGQRQVTTALEPIYIYGESSGTADDYIDYMYYRIKSKYQNGIKFSELAIEADINNKSAELKYITGACKKGTANGGGFYTDDSSGDGNYTVEYLIKGKDYVVGELNDGDIVQMCFELPYTIKRDEQLHISLIPKSGTPILMDLMAPNVISTDRIVLFP